MNRGRLQANGAILYFLHADSYPPKNFDQYLIDEGQKGKLGRLF